MTSTALSAHTRPVAASAHIVGAMALIGLVDIYVAAIAEVISVWQFLLCRTVLALLIICGVCLIWRTPIAVERLWAVGLRSMLVGLAMSFYFAALAFMPIAEALAGLYTAPIWVLLISSALLGEAIGPKRVLAVAMGFGGTLVVLGVQDGLISAYMILPMAGGFLYALGAIVTRRYCRSENAMAMLIGLLLFQAGLGGSGLVALAVFAPEVPQGADGFLLRPWTWSFWPVWELIALQAVAAIFIMAMIVRAYQWGQASQVAGLEYTVMIFGPLFAWGLLGVVVTAIQAIGIALILCSGLILTLRRRRSG